MEKTAFLDFVNKPLPLAKNSEMSGMSFYSLMNDVWGEANRTVEYHKNGDTDHLIKQFEVVDHICSRIYMNPDIIDDEKIELREAHWELYDFCLWDNEWNNTSETVMRWFNQWVFDINYELY